MAKETHKQTRHAPTAATQQQLIWRALVGSLVFCAALAAPARAQQPAPEASNAGSEAEASTFTEINTAPFRSLVAKALRLRGEGSFSSDDTFDFQIEADRAEDGTLRNVGVAAATSNALWHGLARDFLAALSESRVLAALKDARHLSIRLKVGAQDALASLSFEAPTVGRARQVADSYDLLLRAASLGARGKNSAALLSGVKVSASGKQFAAKLEMSREQLGNLLRQSLSLP